MNVVNTTEKPARVGKEKAFTERKGNEIISFVRTLALFFIAAIFLRASVVEAFKIPSGSMIPELKIGDHILVSKLSYGFRLPFLKYAVWEFDQPKRGDVVVFTRPDDPTTLDEDESETNIIKRVVAVAGDIVEVKGTQVYVNNELANEPYARWENGGLTGAGFGPERVPANHVFLLGDNRDHSKDSRFWNEPFLDMRRIKGRALMVYWSWDSMGRVGHVIR